VHIQSIQNNMDEAQGVHQGRVGATDTNDHPIVRPNPEGKIVFNRISALSLWIDLERLTRVFKACLAGDGTGYADLIGQQKRLLNPVQTFRWQLVNGRHG
jgi:hypothetical protein